MSTDVKDAPAAPRERADSAPNLNAVLADALALSRAQRVQLAHELLDSLDDDDESDDLHARAEAYALSPAWEAEIARRIKDLDAGVTKTVPWSEVKASMQATLDKYRGR